MATETADAEEGELTTPRGLARYAYEYIAAARLVDEKLGSDSGFDHISPIPAYLLALHGIELTLKAFLRHKGISLRELRNPRKFGHDIRACYRKAKELGLREIFKMRASDMRALLLLLQLNEYQGLRYIRTGLKQFPSWAIVDPFAVRLHQAVAPVVGSRSFLVSYPAYK